jgi:hypothetical protein
LRSSSFEAAGVSPAVFLFVGCELLCAIARLAIDIDPLIFAK